MTPSLSLLQSPTQLTGYELDHFCKSFRTGNYDIVTTAPGPGVDCERLLACFKDPATYSLILDDAAGTFTYFSIQYERADGTVTQVPIGVYGISQRESVRFPLLLNDFWRDFLMVKLQEFCFMCNIQQSQEQYYGRLLELRKNLITKIFNYYFAESNEIASAMAWDIRGEKSLTRRLATEAGFARVEFLRSEIYSSVDLSPEKWSYLRQCLLKWFEVFNTIVQQPNGNIHPNLPKIGRGFVDFGNTAF